MLKNKQDNFMIAVSRSRVDEFGIPFTAPKLDIKDLTTAVEALATRFHTEKGGKPGDAIKWAIDRVQRGRKVTIPQDMVTKIYNNVLKIMIPGASSLRPLVGSENVTDPKAKPQVQEMRSAKERQKSADKRIAHKAKNVEIMNKAVNKGKEPAKNLKESVTDAEPGSKKHFFLLMRKYIALSFRVENAEKTNAIAMEIRKIYKYPREKAKTLDKILLSVTLGGWLSSAYDITSLIHEMWQDCQSNNLPQKGSRF